MQVLGGIALPGTQYVVLERFLAAHCVSDEEMLSKYWQRMAALSGVEVPLTGPRIWFRFKGAGGADEYISLHPGEYRTTPPGSPSELRDLPTDVPVPVTREMVRAARLNCRTVARNDTAEERLLTAADRILKMSPTATERLARISASARNASDEKFRELLRDVGDIALGFEMNSSDVAFAQLLLQLQRSLGMWIEQAWYTNPQGYLIAFVERMSSDRERAARLLNLIAKGGDIEFRAGQAAVKSAIEADGFGQMTRSLMIAFMHLGNAHWLAAKAEELGIPARAFSYRASVAEEAFVCSLSGITLGALFLTRHPEYEPRDLLATAGSRLEDLQKEAREQSTHIQPVYPRSFADILAAHALTLADDESTVKAGIRELKKAGRQGGLFESRWIDQALLTASKKVGDAVEVQRLAARIAANILIERTLF